MRVHGDNGGIDQVQELVDQVHAPIQQHAAAVLPVAAPAFQGPLGALHLALDEHGPADPTGVKHGFYGAVVLVPAPVLVDGEEAARFFRNGDDLPSSAAFRVTGFSHTTFLFASGRRWRGPSESFGVAMVTRSISGSEQRVKDG